MRQNKKDIKIHSLEGKKARKKNILEVDPEEAHAMIKRHKKRTANIKMKTVIVKGDPFKTQFIVPEKKDSQEVIDRYKKSRKYI